MALQEIIRNSSLNQNEFTLFLFPVEHAYKEPGIYNLSAPGKFRASLLPAFGTV